MFQRQRKHQAVIFQVFSCLANQSALRSVKMQTGLGYILQLSTFLGVKCLIVWWDENCAAEEAEKW